jgi:hypothetical protein
MTNHGERAHAKWAASATARNWNCAGAITLAQVASDRIAEVENIHSARGTAAHQIAEKALRQGLDVSIFLGATEHTKEHKIEIDEELVESAAVYVEYVRARRDYDGAALWIEEKFKLDSIGTPYEAGGTGDAVIYIPGGRSLEIVDLKNGMGVVDVNENKQLRTYALGALLHHQGLVVEQVTTTIVQPRAPHRDGRIRSETFMVADLIDWTNELLAAMHRAKEAELDYDNVIGDFTMGEWADKWLKPGNCKFCPAEGFCPAIKRKAQTMVKMWFDDGNKAHIGNTPSIMSPEDVSATLDQLDMLEDWIKAVRALAQNLADGGTAIPNYEIVDKIGNRKWAADDEKVITDLRDVLKLTNEQIYEPPSVRSVAQIEKVLGAKRKAEIANMWHKPVTGKNLIRVTPGSDAAKSNAAKCFEQPTEKTEN